jgi:hypothetical protein
MFTKCPWARSFTGQAVMGPVHDRLLLAAMAETGLRLGECPSLRHRDWHVGQGSTPFLEVVPATDHPHRMRTKSGRSRRVYVNDDLERLYSEYLWRLVDAGAAEEVDDPGLALVVRQPVEWPTFLGLAPRAGLCKSARGQSPPWPGCPGRLVPALIPAHPCERLPFAWDAGARRHAAPRPRRHPDNARVVRLGDRRR